MAERRMFAKTIVESDAFLSQSIKAQNLYYQLNMKADDDGILNNALTICRSLGFKKDVLDELIRNRFLLDLGDGITVVKHWLINNRIQKDRYKKSVYQDKYEMLSIKDDKAYTLLDNKCNENGQQMDNKWIHRLGKDSIGKESIGYIDDDIQLYNARMLEAGVSQAVIDNAMYLYDTLDCPKTNAFYLQILDVMQNETIVNKQAYLKEVIRNDNKNRKIQA